MKELSKLASAESEESAKVAEQSPIVRYDKVSAKLFNLVGCPVCICNDNGETKGILVSMECADVLGNSLVSIVDGTAWHGVSIDANTVLKELNEKNEWEVTAKNETLDHSICAAVNRKNCKVDVQCLDF